MKMEFGCVYRKKNGGWKNDQAYNVYIPMKTSGGWALVDSFCQHNKCRKMAIGERAEYLLSLADGKIGSFQANQANDYY